MATNQDMHTFIGYSTTDYRLAKSLTEEERKVLGIDLEAIEKGLRLQGANDEVLKSTPVSQKIQERRNLVEAFEHQVAERQAPKMPEE